MLAAVDDLPSGADLGPARATHVLESVAVAVEPDFTGIQEDEAAGARGAIDVLVGVLGRDNARLGAKHEPSDLHQVHACLIDRAVDE
ncbi:hypothetical protein [Cryptosporangium sp. NPDC048952]|uniref:hypothetical protein n=1 Tax=Cryptosporangium sp. NPDC048952 TaxID=3363961 RepID=UPI0037239A6B